MFHRIYKTMLAGVGIAAFTKEKIEGMVKEFQLYGELTEQEARDLVDRMKERASGFQGDIQDLVTRTVRNVMDGLNLATKDDLTEMARRIESLEKRLMMQRRNLRSIDRKAA